MKTKIIIASLSVFVGLFAFTTKKDITSFDTNDIVDTSQVDTTIVNPVMRKVKNTSFKKGEYLEYDASYGYFDAAKATLEIQPLSKTINGRKVAHVVGRGKSLGTFNWFFEVEDRYETYIDESSIIPWKFVRHVREGGYSLDRGIEFDHYRNKAEVSQTKKDTTRHVVKTNSQDLLSAFYYARTLKLQNAKIGQTFTINTFFDREMFPMKIKFLGKEVIETDLGEFNCLKFRPIVEEGRVFKEEEDMTLWVSDDANKVPIRLETELMIGSIQLDLVNHRNLKAPLNKVD